MLGTRPMEAERDTSWDRGEQLERPIRVLLADDDDEFRVLCANALRRVGFVVDGVADGGEFVRYATEVAMEPGSTPRPDVIISDVRMPLQDGLALASAVRELRWTVPVVFITAMDPACLPDDHGAAAVLRKPFSMRELEDIIRSLTS